MATLTETFTNIADAIRSKTETTDKITPENMPAMIESISVGAAEPVIQELSIISNGTYRAPEGIDGYTPITVNVPQDGGPPAEALVITGDCQYRFVNDGWSWFINQYGNQITTKDIVKMEHMFEGCQYLKSIPFEINTIGSSGIAASYMFQGAIGMETVPKINNFKARNINYMFNNCYRLREIPDNFCESWDWDYLESQTDTYNGQQSCIFRNCYSLRKIPQELISHCNPNMGYSYSIYKDGFKDCYVLDEIIDLVVYTGATWTSNAFSNTFANCNKLRTMTFVINEDGTPKVAKWKNQTIDLSTYVGYGSAESNITNYNSGLTTATRITDDATYQALKDNEDNWTTNINYSRYNKTSAIETINSLPDASAYLATQSSGTNTIKFKGAAGALTDGGAINTMTEEEIAVATAKGWTVSFV